MFNPKKLLLGFFYVFFFFIGIVCVAVVHNRYLYIIYPCLRLSRGFIAMFQEAVVGMQANLGGTEILTPLQEIQPKLTTVAY